MNREEGGIDLSYYDEIRNELGHDYNHHDRWVYEEFWTCPNCENSEQGITWDYANSTDFEYIYSSSATCPNCNETVTPRL